MNRTPRWMKLSAAFLLLSAAALPAQDRARSRRRATPAPATAPAPEVVIEFPSDGSYLKTPTAAVRVRAKDRVLSLSVNGVSGSRDRDGVFVVWPVALPEGPVTLTATATDRDGHVSTAVVHVVADRTPPRLTLRAGQAPLKSGASLRKPARPVIEAEDSSEVSVQAFLNGKPFASGTDITDEGSYTLEVQAIDRAGNRARRTVTFRVQVHAPELTRLSPAEGAVLAGEAVAVAGESENAESVTVGGVAASVYGGRFVATDVPLRPGSNSLALVARDAAGNTSRSILHVIRDSAPPVVTVTSPASDFVTRETGVLLRGTARDEHLAKVTVNGAAATLKGPVFEARVSLVEGPNRIVIVAQDAAGNRAEIFRDVIRESEGLPDRGAQRVVGGSAPELRSSDPSDGSLEVPATLVPRLRFSAPVDRSSAGADAVRLVSEADGQSVAASVFVHEGEVAVLPHAALSEKTAYRLEIADSVKDLAGNRLSAGRSIRFTTGRVSPPASPELDPVPASTCAAAVTLTGQADPGSRVRVEGGSELATSVVGADGRFAVSVALVPETIQALRIAVVDKTNRTSLPVFRSVRRDCAPARALTVEKPEAIAAGQAGLSGQVFDDRIGRPIAGAVVTVVAVNGVAPTPPAPSATTASDGSFSLVAPTGEIALRASQIGYAASLRISTVAAGDSITVFDMRLTPEAIVTAGPDGSGSIADAQLSLTLPASSVASGATVRGASLSPQGLAALPPLGWSPAAALSVEVGAPSVDPTAPVTFPTSIAASWDNRFAYPAGTSLLLARFDTPTRRYVAAGSATLGTGATKINASIPSTGSYAVFVADTTPSAPAVPSLGQPLTGVAAPGSDPILSAVVTVTPPDVLPTQTADISAKLTLSAPVPSGYPVEVLVSETLTLLNNQQVQAPSFLEDLTVLRDGTGQTVVPFRVRPSPTAAQVALSVGYENLTVRHYAIDLTRGNLIGSAGGTVSGPSGFSLVIPANALSATVPVSLTQVNPADVPVAIPAGYHLVSAIQLGFGGQTLTQPAALKWASLTDPTGSGLIWVEVRTLNGITRPRFVNPGRYDSVNKLVETTPAAVHNLPVPGVLSGDIYLLLGANQATAYVKGKVLDINGVTPVASAVVTEDGTSLVAVSDGTGGYALPVPASGAVVRSSRLDTGNVGQATVVAQSAGATATKDIPLAVTAPYVTAVAPATASALPLDLPVVFTLSEPLNPSTVSASSITALVGSTPVPGTTSLSATGVQVTFTPTGLWPGKASVKLTLSSTVTDWQGYRLVDQTTKVTADYVVTYNTVDPTPPTDINPLLIYMTVPTGTPPTVTITGTSGAACPGCTVIAVNDTTTLTASTTALSNGSFTLTLPATTTDVVYVIVRRLAGGGEIRVDPGPYRDDGGRVAYLGPRAADYLTQDGIRVTVDQGSYSVPVTLRVSPIAQAALPAPMPAQSTFIAGISFDPGDVIANKPIDISVSAPPGVTGGQFLVARAVQVAGETKWMVIDTARYDNGSITTRLPAGSSSLAMKLASESAVTVLGTTSTVNCPELQNPGGSKDILDRVTRQSNLVILGVQQQLGFIASAVVSADASVGLLFSGQFSALADMLPYVWVAREAKQQCYFALPVPLGVPLTVLGRDASTGLTIFQGNFSAVTDPTNITQLPPGGLAGNLPAPRLIDASPFKAYTFVPASTGGADKPFLSQMTYAYNVVSGSGTLTVKGLAGAVEALADISLTNNVSAAAAVTGNAAADGSFTIAISANPGEDVTFVAGTKSLAPGAQIHLLFSQTIDLPSVQLITLNAGALAYDVVPDSGGRGFTLAPRQPFAQGGLVTLLIPATKIPKALTVKLSSPASSVVGTRDVKDVNALYLKGGLLLEVTGTAGNVGDAGGIAKLNLYDATDPGAVTICSSLPLYDFARGVTMDDHDRVLAAMGGGGTNGRVQVFRLSPPTGSGLCSGRVLVGEGTNPGDLDRSYTETTVRTGAGDLGVLPEGSPRKIELLYRETRATYVVDKDTALPAGVTSIVKTPPAGPQQANATITFVGQIQGSGVAPSPLNQPATLWNATTGQLWTSYADAGGNFTIAGKASSGDRLEIRQNAAEVAVIGTIGFGIQAVDVNKTVHLFGQDCAAGGTSNDICPAAQRLLFSFGRLTDLSPPLCRAQDAFGTCTDALTRLDALTDLALLPAPAAATAGALPAPADPAETTILAAINRFGLATFSLTGTDENVRINQLGPGILVATFDTPPVYPSFFAVAASRGFPVKAAGHRQFCTDAMWLDTGGNPYRPTLAFLASSEGVFVVDVTKASLGGSGSLYPEPSVIGLFRLPSGSATTLSLDSTRGILYVGSDGASGQISAYDMTDPCSLGLAGRVAPATDPRRIASVDLANQNANTAFVVDPDTGVVFGAGDPTSTGNGKAFALALFAPPLKFVADTDHDGQWEEVGFAVPLGVPNPKKPAAPYPPDVVRILASIFGHAGKEIVVELSSTSSTKVLAVDPPVNLPRVRSYVTLTRQSDDPADPGYNRYLSPPIVLIADPRAQKKYSLAAIEDGSSAQGQTNPFACQNCKPNSGYAGELAILSTAPPAANDGSDRAHPIKQAFELWAGERLVARLAENSAAETALKTAATYLAAADLQRVTAEAPTTRADWTPSLLQAPRVNPSIVADEAGGGVVLTSGEASFAARDLSIAGRGLHFALDRFYASQGVFFGPLGRNWDSPLFARLRELPTGDVDFYDGTGRRETFQFDPNAKLFVAPPGRFAELYRLPDLTFFLREHDNTKLRFDATGRLVSISDAVRTDESETGGDGNRVRFFYDAGGKLLQITDALNHAVNLDYYPVNSVKGSGGAYPGLIRTVTDHMSREVLYIYDARGRLTEVRLPEVSSNGASPFTGATRRKVTYTYSDGPDPLVNFKGALLEGDNLLTASNARGQEILRFQYTDAFSLGAAEAVTARLIAGVPEGFSYQPVTGTTIFTSRRGQQTTITHDGDGHPTQASLSGNSTADTNSTNPLSSVVVTGGVVPPGPFTTQFSYSGQDGLTQSVTMPSGSTVSHDYQVVAPNAPDRRQRANVTAMTVAGTGLSLRDQFAYQSLVNQVTSHTDATGAITTFDRDPQKGFVTRVGMPATVGTDAQNPPVPGMDISRDASTGQALSQADKAGAAQGYTYFPTGDPAYGYVKTVTEQASAAGTIYTPVAPSTTTFARDARGNVTSMTDPRGTVITAQVNEADWVVQSAVPSAGITHTFEYDADGNVARETYVQSPLGTATRTFTYDPLGRRMSMTEGGLVAASATTTFAYSSAGELIGVTHPEGEIDLSLYDGRGLLVGQQRRHASGTASAMRTLTRDQDGRVLDDFDGLNTHTTIVYDAVGRASRITTPRGAEVRVDYDGADRPVHVTVVDPASGDILKERRIDYAPNGQVATKRETLRRTPSDPNPQEVSTQFAYDAGERVVRVTDPLNRTSLRSYDDHGRPTRVEDPAHNVVIVDYDLAGNPITRHVFEVKPDGTSEAERIEASTYDTLNRVTTTKDPLNHSTTATYDEESHLISSTDALGHQTTYGYDERGRRVSMVDAVGNKSGGTPAAHKTQWSWDRSGKQAAMTDANGHATSYTYDVIGRLTRITYPDTKFEQKTWNADGTVATATDPNGSVATFSYDPDDQPASVSYTKGAGVIGLTSETYTYDKLGRLLSASSNGGVGGTAHATSRAYDSFDRMFSETEDGKVIARDFDVIGNPIDVTYPGSGRKFVRTFDVLDRASRMEEDISGTRRLIRAFDYFGFNRLAKATAPGSVEANYVYDAARRLTNLTTTNTSTSTDFLKYVLGWADDNVPLYGQRIHEGSKGDVFQHDEDHRLTLATLSQANPTGAPDLTTAYRQDLTLGAVHERTLDKLTLSGTTTNNTVTPNLRYAYTAYGAQTRTYDLSGNLTARASDVFKWDAKNRLAEADLAGGIKLEFGYDALGRRVEKKKTVGANVTTTTWVYDGWNAVQELRNGTLYRESVYGAGLDDTLEYRILGTPNHDYEIFRDATGSTAAVVPDSGGTQLFKYLPFGKGALFSGTTGTYNFDLSTATSSSLWQGLELDPDLGWYYARNRWYDPDTGSFASSDPLGYPDSANPYVWGVGGAFAHDPMGLRQLNERDKQALREMTQVERDLHARQAAGEDVRDELEDIAAARQTFIAAVTEAGDQQRPWSGYDIRWRGWHKYAVTHFRPAPTEEERKNAERLVAGIFFVTNDVPMLFAGKAAAVEAPGMTVQARRVRKPSGQRPWAPKVGIETPYEPAVQSILPEAMEARKPVEAGATLYRLGTKGTSHAAEAQFWTMEHPDTPGFAARHGIPPENVLNADFIEVGTIKPGTPFITRPAPGSGTNPGGGIEVVVPPNGVQVTSFVERK